jgi:hypothetical protein
MPIRAVADRDDIVAPSAEPPHAGDDRPSILSERIGAATAAPEPTPAPATGEIVVKILGRVDVIGMRIVSNRRIVEELLAYLSCHDSHHLRTDQNQAGIWPPLAGRYTGVAHKTFHNYDFERLNREADVKGRVLRTEALELVWGQLRTTPRI